MAQVIQRRFARVGPTTPLYGTRAGVRLAAIGKGVICAPPWGEFLYFATHKMARPRGWDAPHPIGRYWRAALVVFFNYGVDTGTVWKSTPAHEPILWRHVMWDRKSPDREAKERSPWGWLFYRRVKTDKAFNRPMNRVVHAHLRSLMPEDPRPDAPVFLGGGARPKRARFQPAGDAQPRLW